MTRIEASHTTKKLPLRLLVMLLLFLGAATLFLFIVNEVLMEKEVAVDNAVLQYLSTHVVSPRLTGFMQTVSFFASALFLQIAYGIIVLIFLFQRKYAFAILTAFTGVGGFIISYILKISFHRSRPAHPLIDPLLTYSFPSGHATSAFIFYNFLGYLLWKIDLSKTIKIIGVIVLFLFPLLIGFSRMYLAVHFFSDVVAGFCVGLIWLLVIILTFEKKVHLKTK